MKPNANEVSPDFGLASCVLLRVSQRARLGFSFHCAGRKRNTSLNKFTDTHTGPVSYPSAASCSHRLYLLANTTLSSVYATARVWESAPIDRCIVMFVCTCLCERKKEWRSRGKKEEQGPLLSLYRVVEVQD
ncbi:hypothetical protein C0Q70_01056 [Pomacea canaliculata]|uniref:Uncharacterized protein n=1 Tax=Pomacea canaliculata TaxID=400727 RepID=A0A2T7PYE1_POMCA|nr:hypothetical protein C0Q70_01056 [Pomacea canaliculata]